MKKSCLSFIALPLLALGLLLLGLGIKDYFDTTNFLYNSQTTSGQVTSVSQETKANATDSSKPATTYYTPTISYSDSSGQAHTFTPTVHNDTPRHVGDSITVRYSISDPGTAQTDDFSSAWLGTIFLLIIGAFFAGLGGALLVVQKIATAGVPADAPKGTVFLKLLFMLMPDPRKRGNTLNTPAQKAAGNAESLSGYASLTQLPILLLVLGGIIFYLQMQWSVFAGLVAILVFQGLLHIQAGRKIRAISDDGTGGTWLRIFTTAKKYQLYQMILGSPLGLIAGLAILKYTTENPDFIPWLNDTIRLLILVAATSLPLLAAIAGGIRYLLYRRIPTAGKNTAQVRQAVYILDHEFSLIDYLAFLPFILAFLAYCGNFALTHQPEPGGAGDNHTLILVLAFFAFGAVAMAVLGFVSIARMKSINLDTPGETVDPSAPLPDLPASIKAALFGIMNLKRHGVSTLEGEGVMTNNENALLVTDDSLAFIEVPATGKNTLIGDEDYGSETFFWNRQELERNGRTMLAKQSLAGALKSNPKNYAIPLKDVQKFELHKNSRFFITTVEGTQRKFVFLDAGYADELKKVLPAMLGERFTIR